MMKWTSLIILTVTIQMPLAHARHGLKNFKSVLPGLLYRGGNSGGGEVAMKTSSLQGLCNDGFSSAVYLYGRGAGRSLSCGNHSIDYLNLSWDGGAHKILKMVYDAANSGRGPIYAHCWHGVHASGYIAAVALKQFCGYSSEQAVSYWNSHVPPRIRYPHVQAKIRSFQPNRNLSFSSSQASRFCQGIIYGSH